MEQVAGYGAIREFRGSHRWLSNFWMEKLTHDGTVWRSAEHAYQAAKTDDRASRKRTHAAATPAEAKRLGRRAPMRPGWETVGVDVMERILEAKFEHPELQRKLLATGDAVLVQGNWWGGVASGASAGGRGGTSSGRR